MVIGAEGDGRFSPAWLTETLRLAGTLPLGAVAEVETRGSDAFNSAIAHLTVTYTAEAPETAPRRLLLKRNLPAAWAVRADKREARFYQAMSALTRELPMLAPCYAAAFDQSTGEGHVLLLDVSETHRQPLTRDQQLTPDANVPSDADVDQVVEALARFHA